MNKQVAVINTVVRSAEKPVRKTKPRYNTTGRTYPYVGECDPETYTGEGDVRNLIVLFTSPTTGICIDNGRSANLKGYFEYNWSEENFKVFKGQVSVTFDQQ